MAAVGGSRKLASLAARCARAEEQAPKGALDSQAVLEKLLRLEKAVDARVDERLRSLMAAALADPEVDEGGKSLAGFILQRLTPTEEVKA